MLSWSHYQKLVFSVEYHNSFSYSITTFFFEIGVCIHRDILQRNYYLKISSNFLSEERLFHDHTKELKALAIVKLERLKNKTYEEENMPQLQSFTQVPCFEAHTWHPG